MNEFLKENITKTDTEITPKWCVTPSFILRRSAISDITKQWGIGEFLECGTGSGTMTSFFLERDFSGCAYDVTIENLEILSRNLSRFGNKIRTIGNLDNLGQSKFDYLFAFEVLEHIENDKQTLKQWTKYLNQDGKLLISIPARMKFFRADDHHAGHVRRYEKKELVVLLEECGYQDIKICSYGVPLLNISRRIGAWCHKKGTHSHSNDISPTARSIKSGVERIPAIHAISWLLNDVTLLPCRFIQRAFYQFDFGEGYVVTAIKR